MEPSVDIDTRGSCSFRKLACRNSRTNFVAATERDVVFAWLGDSLDRYLRPDRDTVVSAHWQTLGSLIAECEQFGVRLFWQPSRKKTHTNLTRPGASIGRSIIQACSNISTPSSPRSGRSREFGLASSQDLRDTSRQLAKKSWTRPNSTQSFEAR